MWTHKEAIEFLCHLRKHIDPRYHLALAGSVLLEGVSEKDLDVIIFPNRTNELDDAALRASLGWAGLTLTHDAATVKRRWWREHRSKDTKHVEVWETAEGKRADLFFFECENPHDRELLRWLRDALLSKIRNLPQLGEVIAGRVFELYELQGRGLAPVRFTPHHQKHERGYCRVLVIYKGHEIVCGNTLPCADHHT